MSKFFWRISLLAFSALLSLSACKKENEPSFKDRLVGGWKSDKVTFNGADVSALIKFDLELRANRTFKIDLTTLIPPAQSSTQYFSGDWQEDAQKQSLTLSISNSNQPPSTIQIEDLSDQKMEAEINFEGNRYRVSFVKK